MRIALVVVLAACNGGSAAPPDATCSPAVLYLNRTGATFQHAAIDDATANVTPIVEEPTRDMPPWPHDDIDWASLTGCIRAALAPLPVTVTETDPGTTPHTELVFTTAYWAGPAGTTAMHTAGCEDGYDVGFVFGNALPTYARACHVALRAYGQMAANLAIADDCEDVLNNDVDCSLMRTFKDVDATCVDAANAPIACRCGGTTQNSHRAMLAATSCP